MRAYFWVFWLWVVATACQPLVNKKNYRIGFSQCTGGDNWRQVMLHDMQRQLAIHPNWQLLYKDASNSTTAQIKQIKELTKQGIDLLIVSPNESSPALTLAIEAVFKQGIPVILLDRKIPSESYTTFIGANNLEIGRMVGDYLPSLLPKGGNIVEVWGLASSSPAQERHRGLHEELSKYPHLHVIKELYGQWEKDTASHLAQANLDVLRKAQVVFAHNDIMAESIRAICQKENIRPLPYFVGIDGLPGPKGGLQKIQDGILKATFLYPTGGEEAIEVAAQVLAGKATQREYLLNSIRIDQSNLRVVKAQSDKLLQQQQDIEKLNQQINYLAKTYSSQKEAFYLILACLILSVLLGGWAVYLLRTKQAANRQLALQNQQISEQKSKIEEVSEKARQATEEKLRFYSYISHEFRTPLSLILTPVEDLLAQKAISQKELKTGLTYVQKNAHRLLHLVDQLLDLRKTDAGKQTLHASEHDLVAWLREIVSNFLPKAIKLKIDLQLLGPTQPVLVWFDAEKLDKVVFNLLSNAFKYTPQGGRIHVILTETTSQITLAISDNGEGMTEVEKQHAFDLFFSGLSRFSLGTGVGLALTREFVNLHHGDIVVESTKHQGTTFTITLPKGDAHLGLDEKNKYPELPLPVLPAIFDDLDTVTSASIPISSPSNTSVVLIEDNLDLSHYIITKLTPLFTIQGFSTGEAGWQGVLSVVPDIIICDVMLPDTNGYALTERIKEDFRTSHIPIVMLTAKSQTDAQIEGIRAGADVYITKPFNTTYLIETLKTLCTNRAKIQRRFSSEYVFVNENKAEKRFLNELTARIEARIIDPDFGVEALSNDMGMSRVQLYRKTQALLQMNVSDYITEIRLNKAKSLLRSAELSIAEVAFAAGFKSAAYFTTLFRQKLNQTPSEYRKEMTK